MGRLHRKLRGFYGYRIVAVTFVCQFLRTGFGLYAFSLFVEPLHVDFAWGRTEIMAGYTIYFMTMGLASPFVGRLIGRYSARMIIAAGALVGGLGFVLLSRVDCLWQFYLGYATVGFGGAAIGPVAATAVISNWFRSRRGTAIGVMSTGLGAGGAVLAPIIGGFFMPTFGWSATYFTMGILLCVLVTPLAVFVIKTRPADMGLCPDGDCTLKLNVLDESSPTIFSGLTLKMALATSAFWLIAISYLASSFSSVGSLQSLVPHLQDIGLSALVAANVLGGLSFGSLLAHVFFGWLCDRLLPKYACAIGLSFQLLGIAMLKTVSLASPLALVWASGIILGIGTGSWLTTMSMVVSKNFGLLAYGSIFGVISLFQYSGLSTGPLVAGYVYDVTGGYHWAFIAFILLYAISIPAILVVRRPKSFRNEAVG